MPFWICFVTLLFLDPIMCSDWMDYGNENGFRFSNLRNRNSYGYGHCGGFPPSGELWRRVGKRRVKGYTSCCELGSNIYDACWQEGKSNYFKGLMLILCYLIVAASFFVHHDRSNSSGKDLYYLALLCFLPLVTLNPSSTNR